jgi:uncharacterized protein (DUF1501 family)
VLPPGVLGRSLSALGVASAADGTWQARVAKSYADLGRAATILGPAVPAAGAAKKHGKKGASTQTPTAALTADPDDPDAPSSTASSAGGTGALAQQLDVVASLVEAGVPTRAYSVSLGGFDTHADERGTQQRLLGDLDAALSGFAARLATTDRGKQVVTLVYSEFGRRVVANASEGTDHGTAGPVFVIGKGVVGGFHGAQPSLTDLDNGDLKAGTDFRDVYASILQNVLGADPGAVLDGHTGQVDKLFAA